MPFKNLFRSATKSSDGLTQAAREAIVDVLHYTMFADKHIAVSEDEFIEATARTLDWDPGISYESYEEKSTGAVTRALSDDAARHDFFESLKVRLPHKSSRELALKLAKDLAASDGQTRDSETAAIMKLRSVLE